MLGKRSLQKTGLAPKMQRTKLVLSCIAMNCLQLASYDYAINARAWGLSIHLEGSVRDPSTGQLPPLPHKPTAALMHGRILHRQPAFQSSTPRQPWQHSFRKLATLGPGDADCQLQRLVRMADKHAGIKHQHAHCSVQSTHPACNHPCKPNDWAAVCLQDTERQWCGEMACVCVRLSNRMTPRSLALCACLLPAYHCSPSSPPNLMHQDTIYQLQSGMLYCNHTGSRQLHKHGILRHFTSA